MKTQVKMEALSETMLEGTIIQWLKREGETVERGETFLEVESDKASVEVDSPVSGVIIKILYKEGESVPVGEVIMIVESREHGDGPKETGMKNEEGDPAVQAHQTDTPGEQDKTAASKADPAIPEADVAGRIPASPAAKRLVKEHGLKMENIKGTGPNGLITEADVRAHLDKKHGPQEIEENTASADIENKYGEEQHIPLAGIRRTIAERMSLSRHTAADVTTVLEVDMTDALRFKQGKGLPITPIIVKAAVEALKQFPILNSSLIDGDIVIKKYININVAVATEHGLVVPAIHNAEAKSLDDIARELKELTQRARERRLSNEDLADGTFTITNSGIFGSYFFTPIINQPQSAILGVGAIRKAPAVVGEGIAIRSLMYLSLSYDHRVIDGEPAVRFLSKVKENLEHFDKLM